jgi:outer membrane protein assembly factor BamB
MRKILFMLLFVPLLAAQQSIGMEGVKWVFNAGDSIIASPAIHNDVVYAGSANGYLYAVSSLNGTRLWSYGQVDRIHSSPAVSDDMVFFGSNDGYMYALWLNGTLAWKFQTGDAIFSSPALSKYMVFFGSNDGYMYALWLNGTLAWKFQTNNKLISSPLFAYGLLYFASVDGSVYSFYPETGKMQWNYSGDASFVSSPAASNWMIYIGSDDGTLYAFNAFNGTLVWKENYPGKIQSGFAASSKNILYFTCKDGNAYAVYAADGSKFWSVTTGTEAQSSVRYDESSGFSYFGTSDNNLYAVDPKGHPIWRFETGNWVIATPLVLNGMLYAGSYDGNLYAISTIRTSFPSTETNLTGPLIQINGTSYADAGVEYTQIRFNDGEWENVSGKEEWSYLWNTSSLKDGGYLFEARSIDAIGNIEPPPYINTIVMFASKIELRDMVVSYQKSVVAGMPMRFEVNDTEGNAVPYPEVTIFDKTYTGDENGVVASDENGNPIKSDADGDFNFTVSKPGYNTQSLSIKVLKVVDVLPYIIAVVVALIAIVLLIFLGVRKLLKKMKKQ